MFIQLSAQAPAGKVTFFVTNTGKETHEFVVMQTDTPAANFPLTGFEGEKDRFNEDTVGVNVGETGDVPAGESKTLAITLAPGHYALVCNLPGHYWMGMAGCAPVGRLSCSGPRSAPRVQHIRNRKRSGRMPHDETG